MANVLAAEAPVVAAAAAAAYFIKYILTLVTDVKTSPFLLSAHLRVFEFLQWEICRLWTPHCPGSTRSDLMR